MWEETERFDVAPVRDGDVQGRGPEARQLVRDMLFGFTVVRLRCTICGDVASRKLEGVPSGYHGRLTAVQTREGPHL